MRIGAIGAGVAGGGALALLLLWPAAGALDRLATARHAQAVAAQAPATPPALVAGDLAWPTGEADAATMIAGELRARARAGGVLVERMETLAAPAGLVTLDVRLSGSERAVLALADGFERGTPFARWRSWRLSAAPGGVRLQGELVAAWR